MTDAACILVADDDKAIRTVLNQASRLGYVVKSTGTASNLWQWIEEGW